MRTFKVSDGTIIRAKDAADFVRQLHETSHAPAADDFEFMSQVAERTMTQTVGGKIRYETPEQFLASLIHHKLVEEI